VANFNASPTSGTAPLAVTFSNQSTGTLTSYAWNFGDGTTSTAANPTHSYAAAGTYSVSLTVSGAGTSNTKTRANLITVSAPTTAPVANFSANKTSGTAPLSVVFTSASTGSISSYAWNFGDGTSSTAQNPTHSYAAAGTYSVSLTVSGNGRSDTETKSNYITVTQPSTGKGSLAGSAAASSASVNLSSVGTTDWAHWSGYDHKANGGSKISTYTKIGSATVYSYSNDPRAIGWSGGTPAARGSNWKGVYIAGIGNGFQISAPADTTLRTLRVYVGGWKSGGKLTAHLSDNSAVDYVHSSFSGSWQYDGVYTLTYKAASAGQRISVKWTQTSGSGNVTLQGAALAGFRVWADPR
jgi:PKD repeat protein